MRDMWSRVATAELPQLGPACMGEPPIDSQILYFFLGSIR